MESVVLDSSYSLSASFFMCSYAYSLYIERNRKKRGQKNEDCQTHQHECCDGH